jgi:chitinase
MKFGLVALSATLCTLSGISVAAELPDKVAAAWFAGWHEGVFPPSRVPWKSYSHMTYAFAYVPLHFTKPSLLKPVLD